MSVRAPSALPRIAIVSRRYWPQTGGAESAMGDLAGELARRGHRTVVVTAQWEAHWPSESLLREVPLVRLPQPQVRGWGTIRYMHALRRWLRTQRHEFDAVIVSNLRHDAYTAVHALHGTLVPVIICASGVGTQNDLEWQSTARFGGRMRNACQRADAIVAPHAAMVSELLTAGYSPARVRCISPGVPLPPLRGDPDRGLYARLAVSDAIPALEMVPDAPLALYAGRLEEGQGLADLVRAWVKIAERRPNARLWMIGEGPYREALYDLIVDLGLHHQVFLPGAFDDIAEMLHAATLLVAPSHRCGLGMTIIEALAAGLPVIATDLPGHRCRIAHEREGLLVPVGNPRALHGAISRLLDERDFAARLGRRARERAEAEFSVARMADDYLTLVREVSQT